MMCRRQYRAEFYKHAGQVDCKTNISIGVNVFVFAISMMNWVFSCHVAYAC